ncbi:sulfate ABC transporter permease subunit CysT [Coralloluteibacterium stylophorae]|uniref:Sulfate transport system permease protein CysT n=1 Tax=Coralloluteibacterium stylophorae TaxID=1776034 RepID=A0A8J7VQU2_9GAMM|nr:sulfate ABC transporter permease subunit CysT [Coralloluteibacterium stylophorae]MBS7456965.1 sulfate ABC transporter permease subunit CysT [Coralloluteibacterium stylophorae]
MHPGFRLTLGITAAWLGLVVLLPVAAVLVRVAGLDPAEVWRVATSPRALAAYRLSFGLSLAAALANLVLGTLTAWVLVRYRFPGRRLLDGMIDLPFALPTAVAGIALATLYAPGGWLGRPLAALGLDVAFTPLGILVALIFVGLPFVVRTVQPVLYDLDASLEEAAASLGATRLQVLRWVVLRHVLPAALTGFTLSFSRAIGEYGSVIFIAGNIPYVSEIAPLLIVVHLEQFDYVGASVIAVAMLLISFAMLLAINLVQRWSGRRERAHA